MAYLLRYWQLCRYWMWLGAIAFSSMLAVYALMVFKPALPSVLAILE